MGERRYTAAATRAYHLAWVVVLAACADVAPTPRAQRLVQSDSAGIHIVEHGALDLSLNILEAQTPSLRIGAMDGPAEHLLFAVRDAARLDDGAFAIVNGSTSEIRIYEADGTHRVTVGGAGPGPSELRGPVALVVLPGDTIQVQDYLRVGDYHDRVYFESDGSFIRRETTDRAALGSFWQDSDKWWLPGTQWLTDDRMLMRFTTREVLQRQPRPAFRPPMTFLVVSADLVTVDTLGTFGDIRQVGVSI